MRHHPHDVSRIHVRGPDGWITAFWKHPNRVPMPFGELAWDQTRRGLGQGASEEEIADAVAALLRRAGEGPGENAETALSKRDRRVFAGQMLRGGVVDGWTHNLPVVDSSPTRPTINRPNSASQVTQPAGTV
jgi:hypothetical protein